MKRLIFYVSKNTLMMLALMIVVSVCVLCFVRYADACSVMMKTNKQGTFVGRTSDFFGPLKTRLEIIPVGYMDQDPVTKLSWKVKYGVVGVNDFNILYEGINQKGLTAHILLQEDGKLPAPVPDKKAISVSWAEYILTTCATVKEAVDQLQTYQTKPGDTIYQGKSLDFMIPHLAIFDASGDASIIEFNNGKMEVFHGPQYNVLTNAPNMHEQLDNLAKVRDGKTLFSIGHLPGGADAKNRFVRATFNMENMPEPENALQGVIFMEEAVHNIAVPAYVDPVHHDSITLSDAWETRWHVVYDVKNLRMYFDNNQIGKRILLDIKKNVNFKGKAIEYIDPAKTKSAKSSYGL